MTARGLRSPSSIAPIRLRSDFVSRAMLAPRIVTVLFGLCSAGHALAAGPELHEASCPCQVPAKIDAEIAFYEKQVKDDPRRSPAWALLAHARLERAAWSGDSLDVQAARDCGARSIEIQPNLAAFKVLAAAANYSHRFAEALPWCDKADAAAPGERQVLAMRTEALLALNRPEELERLLDSVAATEGEFYLTACRAQLLAARGDRAGALKTYDQVAKQAAAANATQIALWARVAAAGVCLDSGHPQAAVPLLEQAEKLSADDPDVIVHRAEYDEAIGREAQALEAYERLLERQCNPELYRRASRLRRKGGDAEGAAKHFGTAERLWRAAIERGEAYPLEGLSGLYCDAGVQLDEAVRLAEENLKHKRDAAAEAALARAVRLRDGKSS
jgi:tetratricopeptide (TPR) repeat protein